MIAQRTSSTLEIRLRSTIFFRGVAAFWFLCSLGAFVVFGINLNRGPLIATIQCARQQNSCQLYRKTLYDDTLESIALTDIKEIRLENSSQSDKASLILVQTNNYKKTIGYSVSEESIIKEYQQVADGFQAFQKDPLQATFSKTFPINDFNPTKSLFINIFLTGFFAFAWIRLRSVRFIFDKDSRSLTILTRRPLRGPIRTVVALDEIGLVVLSLQSGGKKWIRGLTLFNKTSHPIYTFFRTQILQSAPDFQEASEAISEFLSVPKRGF